jgi:hypothetical protein
MCRATLIVTPKSSMFLIFMFCINISLKHPSNPWLAAASRKVPKLSRQTRFRILTSIFTCRHIHAGQLRLAVYHGPNRHLLSSNFWQTDIVLTTYETLRLECEKTGPLYSGIWRRVVLDEGWYHGSRSCLNTSSLRFQHIIFATGHRNHSRQPRQSPQKAGGVLQARQYTIPLTTTEHC